MRHWYELSFTPYHSHHKSKYYTAVTDLEIAGKSFEKWLQEARNQGYNDAVTDMRSLIKPKEVEE